jgi:hypothetical protein
LQERFRERRERDFRSEIDFARTPPAYGTNEVDGEVVAQVGSGAILGERAVLGDGRRSATLRAARSSRVAVIGSDEISRPHLAEISASRMR